MQLTDKQVESVMFLYEKANEAFGPASYPEDNQNNRFNVKEGLFPYDDTGHANLVARTLDDFLYLSDAVDEQVIINELDKRVNETPSLLDDSIKDIPAMVALDIQIRTKLASNSLISDFKNGLWLEVSQDYDPNYEASGNTIDGDYDGIPNYVDEYPDGYFKTENVLITGAIELLSIMFQALDSDFDPESTIDVIKSSDNHGIKNDLAVTLEKLENLFGLQTSSSASNINHIFDRIISIGKALGAYEEGEPKEYRIIDLSGYSQSDLIELVNSSDVNESDAAKYAILNFNGFMITGDVIYNVSSIRTEGDQFVKENYWLDKTEQYIVTMGANKLDSDNYYNNDQNEGDTLYIDFKNNKELKNFITSDDFGQLVFGNINGGKIEGSMSSDRLYGDIGVDFIKAGEGSDKVYAGDGNDVVFSNDLYNNSDGVVDELFGGKGDDYYFLGSGDIAKDTEGADIYYVNTTASETERIVIDDADGF
ncbi:hypothetical protein [Motiliproteus sp.]|uniref:hypothetical protein n=1 Tax=Motiliproteus sp. TaxID=1898955 RepID=UPI003BA97417